MMNSKRLFQVFVFMSVGMLSAALQGCGLIEAIAGPAADAYLEFCEVPALVVTKTEDTLDGICNERDCSLRDAVVMANACEGEQTIQLSALTFTLTRAGAGENDASTGDLDIKDDLTIDGEGAVIDGGGIDRVFEILGSSTVVNIGRVTIQNGRVIVTDGAAFGGGLDNAGELHLSEVSVLNNRVEGAAEDWSSGGAGIYNQGTLSVSGSIISNNEVISIGEGGGIYNSGSLFVSGSTLEANRASWFGAGLMNDWSADAAVHNTTFRNNEADKGGGLANFGSLTLERVTINGNEAGTHGGGIYLRGMLSGTMVSLIGNQAHSDGGAMHLRTGAVLNLDRSSLEANLAHNAGAMYLSDGASAIFSEGSMIGNSSDWGVGGIYITDPSTTLSLINVTISGNISGPRSTTLLTGWDTLVILDNVTIYNNATDGIWALERSTVNMRNSIIANSSGVDCISDGLVSEGNNLDSDGTCALTSPTDLSGVDPMLLSLVTDGGVGRVHPLDPESPAIDAAGIDCPAIDQRGVTRPQNFYCDIGAFELEWDWPMAPEPTVPPPVITVPVTTEEIIPPDVPLATFTKNANCRRGPSTAYGVVTSLLEGQEVMLEGRNADNSWWWALLPQSTAHCWVSDTTVEVIGPVVDLPIIAAPPLPTDTPTPTPKPPKPKPTTPQPSPPAAPAQLTITKKVCTDTEYSVTLGWMDIANNEDGYRVFRDGQLIATLAKNATGYKDNPPGSGPYTYGVEAFNAAGSSQRPSVYEDGCLP